MPDPLRRPHIYAGPYLDRNARLRDDASWLETLSLEADAFLIPVWQARNLVVTTPGGPQARLLEWRHARDLVSSSSELVLLGEFRNRLCFAFELRGAERPVLEDAEFADLRAVGGALDHDEAGLLAYARAMILWRGRHRFCGACGAPTSSSRAGHVMTCSRCETPHFPRIDPAIIVLVSEGEGANERALLGRQAAWPAGRYSTIAGFVEPGESLEDAVAREVREETGVDTAEITYHSSQPWPFPASLMLGFTARARSVDITCHDGELEGARWFSRADLDLGRVLLPPAQSISYRLIDDWRRTGSR